MVVVFLNRLYEIVSGLVEVVFGVIVITSVEVTEVGVGRIQFETCVDLAFSGLPVACLLEIFGTPRLVTGVMLGLNLVFRTCRNDTCHQQKTYHHTPSGKGNPSFTHRRRR